MAVEACQLLAYSGQVHPQPIITPPSSFLNNKLVSHAILTLEAEGEMTGTYNEGAPSAWRSNNGGWGASECCYLRDLDCWRNDWYPRRIGTSQHLRLSSFNDFRTLVLVERKFLDAHPFGCATLPRFLAHRS